MTWQEHCSELIRQLPRDYVESLITSLRANQPPPPVPNPLYASLREKALGQIPLKGSALASVLDFALAAEKSRQRVELVWTGPEVPNVPARQTEQLLLEMIRGASQSLTICSFGIFDIPRIVQELTIALSKGVKVSVVLGEREHHSEQAHQAQIEQLGPEIRQKANIYRWPLERRQRDDNGHAGLMHIKAAVADGNDLLLTSANLTGAGLALNMELGLILRNSPQAQEVDRLVRNLIDRGELARVETGTPGSMKSSTQEVG